MEEDDDDKGGDELEDKGGRCAESALKTMAMSGIGTEDNGYEPIEHSVPIDGSRSPHS